MLNEAKPVVFLIPFFILETTSNLLQPDYSIKIVNTENIILSLGDLDDENDLEMINATPDPILEKKLLPFHKYLRMLEMEKRAIEKQLPKLYRKTIMGASKLEYLQNLPFRFDRKRWRPREKEPERRRKRGKNIRKKLRNRVEFRKYRRKSGIVKRQMPKPADEEYDYLAKDYWTQVKKSFENNTAFKYSEEGKPEESVKDIIHKITDLKTPKNCSIVMGVGVQAVECAVKDYKENEIDAKEMMARISLIIFIWFAVYMAFAVPLWCTRGWCCCCFRCEICQPVKVVRDIQAYLAQNPPGIYVSEDGIEERYDPTNKETELYEKLTRAIADF